MMILLRLIHIFCGAFWFGVVVFTSVFLTPALAGDAATMGRVMQGLGKRGFVTVMVIVPTLSVLSGLTLIWVTSGGHLREYMATASGHTFSMAGGLAIVAFLFGFAFVRPTVDRAKAVGGQMAAASDPAEKARLGEQMAALQQRLKVGSLTVLVLLVLAVAGMSVARYV